MPDRYMEFLNASVRQSAANTYTQEEVDLPVSENENLAMLIHRIDLFVDTPDIVDATWTRVAGQLTWRSEAGMIWWDDPSLIARLDEDISTGQAQGTLSEFFDHRRLGANVYIFQPAVLVAQRQIFIATDGDGCAAAMGCVARIGYTIEKVSKEAFISSLVGYRGY
jgi:hypothetical protein